MLNSHVTFGVEEHVRECAFNGHNRRERWGGVPVVLFFGDDYQLPPTDKKGAINGFHKFHNSKTMTARSKNNQICEYEGCQILIDMMTEEVFMLTRNFRTTDKEDSDAANSDLMNRMRGGPNDGGCRSSDQFAHLQLPVQFQGEDRRRSKNAAGLCEAMI